MFSKPYAGAFGIALDLAMTVSVAVPIAALIAINSIAGTALAAATIIVACIQCLRCSWTRRAYAVVVIGANVGTWLGVAAGDASAAEMLSQASTSTVSMGSILGTVIEASVTLFGSVLAAAASLWLKRLADAIGISVDEASRERLEEIIHNGAVATASELGVTLDGRWPLDVRSAMLAGTADYLINHGRGTLRRLGANPRDPLAIQQIVVPRLAGIVTSAAGVPLPPPVPPSLAARG